MWLEEKCAGDCGNGNGSDQLTTNGGINGCDLLHETVPLKRSPLQVRFVIDEENNGRSCKENI